MGPYRFCSGGTLDKPSSGYRFGYRFRVGPYRFCSEGNPTTLSILLWSYLILSDTHVKFTLLLLNPPVFSTPKKYPRIFGCSAFEFALQHIRLRVNKLPKKLTASLPLKMESWKTIRLPFLLGAISAYFQWLLLLVLGSVKVAEIVLIR